MQQLQAILVSDDAADEKNLEAMLNTVVQHMPSFKATGHKVSQLNQMAKELWSLDIKSITSFVHDTVLFDQKEPRWLVKKSTVTRASAVAIHKFLTKAVQQVEDKDIVLESDQEVGDKSRDRGRKARRSRSRRKRRSKHSSESSSSTSASERVRRRQDDSIGVISKSEFKVFGQQSFPDPKIVNKVAKHKNTEGQKAYLSSIPLEEWVPNYVGQDMQAKVRKELRTNRAKGFLTGVQLIEHSVAFWATHGLNGSVTTNAVTKHVMVLGKIISTKGVPFCAMYIRKLIGHIQQTWVDRDNNQCKSFDEFLKSEVTEVISIVNNHMAKGQGKNKGDGGQPKNEKPPRLGTRLFSGAKGRLDKLSPIKEQNPRSERRPGPKGPKGNAKGKGKGPTAERQVCAFHNPADGSSRRHGDQCLWDHLDTTVPSNKKKWEESVKQFKARKDGPW